MVLGPLLELLLPSVCPACRVAEGPGLCETCHAQLPAIQHPCEWCAAPRRAEDESCRSCGGAGIANLRAVAVRWHYRGLVQELVHQAKVIGRPAAIRALAGLAPDPPAPLDGAIVVPIPPSPGRRSGPHLATAVARALARRLSLPLRRLLTPTRHAAEQHRLGVRERNVDGLFSCRAAPGARVVLVDDLLTSGATAASAGRALRAAGAKDIVLVCVARTPRAGEWGGENHGREP